MASAARSSVVDLGVCLSKRLGALLVAACSKKQYSSTLRSAYYRLLVELVKPPGRRPLDALLENPFGAKFPYMQVRRPSRLYIRTYLSFLFANLPATACL